MDLKTITMPSGNGDQPLQLDPLNASLLVNTFHAFNGGPEVIDAGLVKVDHTTVLEWIGRILFFLGIGLLVVVWFCIDEEDFFNQVPKFIKYIGIGLVPLIIGWIIRKKIDVYYIFDLEKRQILLLKEVFRKVSTNVFCSFGQVDFVTVTGESPLLSFDKKSVTTGQCNYQVLVVFKNGTSMKIPGRTTAFKACGNAASYLADVFGCRYVAATPNCWARLKKKVHGGEADAEFVPTSWCSPPLYKRRELVIAAIFLVLLCFLIAIFRAIPKMELDL